MDKWSALIKLFETYGYDHKKVAYYMFEMIDMCGYPSGVDKEFVDSLKEYLSNQEGLR